MWLQTQSTFLFNVRLLFFFPFSSCLIINDFWVFNSKPAVHSRKCRSQTHSCKQIHLSFCLFYYYFFCFSILKYTLMISTASVHYVCVWGRSSWLRFDVQAYLDLLQTITTSQPAASCPLSQIITRLCAICPCSAGICVMSSNWTKRK